MLIASTRLYYRALWPFCTKMTSLPWLQSYQSVLPQLHGIAVDAFLRGHPQVGGACGTTKFCCWKETETTKNASVSPTQNRIGVGWTKQSQEPVNQPTSGEFLATLAPACVKDHPELLSRSTQSNDTSAVVREEISVEIGSTSVSCCG